MREILFTPVHLMMMANMSIVMQLVRCATGGLNREAVMQSGEDRDAGHRMVEASDAYWLHPLHTRRPMLLEVQWHHT